MEEPVTLLLKQMADGDESAASELFELVYSDLRARAARLMQSEHGHTLQPTAVVNEAWMKLAGGGVSWESRGHFLGVAAKAMRSVLVDHARAKKASKRGGDAQRVALDAAVHVFEERALDLVRLDAALEQLNQIDPKLGQLVELRFFGGLTIPETAEVMGVSTPTIERGWRAARSWLGHELSSKDEHDG